MTMRRFLTHLGVLAVVAGAATSGVQAEGQSPAQLQRAGWDCLNPEPFFQDNPKVHCFPPGQLEAIGAGTAVSAMLKAFDTPDVNAEEAPFLGTERMLRADHFNNQPCPTDPPGAPSGEARKNSVAYEWSYLGPRFGWDYYICHSFDSPW